MVEKKPPHEPTNTTTHNCNLVIFNVRRTVLKISPHYWKRNEEFRSSKKKKIKENLEQYLLNDQIIKDLVRQLHLENPLFEVVNSDWPSWKYYAYEPVVDKRNGMDYRILIFLDDNFSELVGVVTVYPSKSKSKLD